MKTNQSAGSFFYVKGNFYNGIFFYDSCLFACLVVY